MVDMKIQVRREFKKALETEAATSYEWSSSPFYFCFHSLEKSEINL